MIALIRPASFDDISSIVEIENKTNQMPWSKAQFLSSMEVGHYSVVMHKDSDTVSYKHLTLPTNREV